MAETPPKRRRELTGDAANSGDSDLETTKRQKQETNQDLLLDFFTNLSSDPFVGFNPQPEPDPDNNPNKDLVQDDDDEKESVIRHLLEASDDELGIPSRVDGGDGGGDGDGDGDGGGDGGGDVAGGYFGDFEFGLSDGLWELEDEVANANYYYTLLQSELFMQ